MIGGCVYLSKHTHVPTGFLYQVRDLELLGRMSVDAMVLDSPFADFYQLAEVQDTNIPPHKYKTRARSQAHTTIHSHMLAQELVDKGKEHGVHVPRLVVKMALHMVKSSVQKVVQLTSEATTPPKSSHTHIYIHFFCPRKHYATV